ncbi:MAG: WG repeat-containing protein, partial [Bacteroidales bacterium]
MKKLILFSLSILFSLALFSQNEHLTKELLRTYDSVYDLRELKPSTLYSFTTNGKVGLIDRLGFLVYEPYFDSVYSYEANNFIYIKGIMSNGRIALLNQDGKILFQPIYEDVFVTEEDLVLTKFNNKYGLVSFDGLGYLYPEFDTIKVMIDEDTFFVASMGDKNMVFNTSSDIVEYFDSDTVISLVEIVNSSLLPFAWTCEPKYDVVKYLGGGNFYTREGDKKLIVNRKGEVVEEKKININAKDVVSFDWSRIFFKADGFVGMMDYEGRVIVEPKYQDMSVVVEDEVYSYRLNDSWGLINKEGKVLTNPQFVGFKVETYNNGQFIKALNSSDKRAVLNKKGRPIMQAFFDDVEYSNHPHFFNQINNGGKGIISQKGVLYVQPEYDQVNAYLEVDTFFVAKRNNRFTIFGTRGDILYDGLNTIIDIQDSTLTYVEDYKLKRAIIRNKEILPNAITLKVDFKEVGQVFDSLMIIKDKKGWTYVDKQTLKPITKKHYDFVTPFHRGYALVIRGKELNVIDKDFEDVFSIVSSGLVKSELEAMANLIYDSYKRGKGYQYI